VHLDTTNNARLAVRVQLRTAGTRLKVANHWTFGPRYAKMRLPDGWRLLSNR
jgi:hypothetical protein